MLYERPYNGSFSQFMPVMDVAETTDGRVVLATGLGPSALIAIMPNGRQRVLAKVRGGVRAIGADRDGRILAAGFRAQVVRVDASGKSTVLAERISLGSEFSLGYESTPAGVVRTADGSVVFTDTGTNRLRRVRPDGVVETIAGGGDPICPGTSCPPAIGDGGPATQATLSGPTDVLATSDGGLVVAEGGGHRIRRIAPDGTIATIAGTGADRPLGSDADEGRPATEVPIAGPSGLAQLPNGDILFVSGPLIHRLTPDGRWHTFLTILNPAHFGENPANSLPMTDFAGRRVPGFGEHPMSVAVTQEGGLLLAAQNAYYLAPRHSRRTLVAIRGARTSDREVTVNVEASRAARATLSVRLAGRTIAQSTRPIRAGSRTLRVTGSFASRLHDVRVTLRGPGGATDRDALALYLGRSLSMTYARQLARFGPSPPLHTCQRMRARRIDCAYGTNNRCRWVISLALRQTGLLWRGGYECKDMADAFRRHPEWTSAPGVWPPPLPDDAR